MKNNIKALLIVIIVLTGVILILTDNKKTDSTDVSKPTNAEDPQPNITLVDGRQCYTYSHEATTDAPYTVQEFIDITIDGQKVTGTKTGTQSGPDMTNGYEGSLVGELENNTITGIFSYTIEGSQNKEKEIYKANKTGIEKWRYPLIEQDDMLVPDLTQDFTALSYARVECDASN